MFMKRWRKVDYESVLLYQEHLQPSLNPMQKSGPARGRTSGWLKVSSALLCRLSTTKSRHHHFHHQRGWYDAGDYNKYVVTVASQRGHYFRSMRTFPILDERGVRGICQKVKYRYLIFLTKCCGTFCWMLTM